MRGLALVVLVPLLAGCLTQEDGPTDALVVLADDALANATANATLPAVATGPAPLPAIANLTLVNGEAADLRLGVGWGRLTVHATDTLVLKPTLTHDTMEDISMFTDAGDGIYDDPQQHTVVHAFPAGDLPLGPGTWSFLWWGNPGWSVWPSNSAETFEWDSVELDAGANATIVVANTVPGYTLHLGTPGNASRDWNLTATPGHLVAWPEAVEGGMVNGPLGVQHSWSWDLQVKQQPPSILYQRRFDWQSGLGARAEVTQDQMACIQPGSSTSVVIPDAEYDYSVNGEARHASTSYGPTDETYDFDCFRDRSTTGVDGLDDGIATAWLFVPY